MIGIQLDGDSEFLETMPDTSIEMTLENPLLGEDKLSPGSYSFPFTLPVGSVSPKNAGKLKHPDVIENNEAYQLQKARLFFDGVPFKLGNLKTKSAAGGSASAYFTFGLSTIHESLKKAKLRDVVAENAIISATSIARKIYIKKVTDPANDWDITLNGINYKGTEAAIISAINADGELTVDTGKHMPFVVNDPGTNSPQGFLTPDYLVITLCTYVLSFDPITETWINLAVEATDPLEPLSISTGDPANYMIEFLDLDPYYDDFDTFLATFPSDKLVFPVRFNASPYGDQENLKNSELVNGVNASGIIRNQLTVLAPRVINRNSLQPFVRLKHVLDKIATTFAFEWEGDFYNHADLPGFLVDNTYSLDSPQLLVEGEVFVFWKRRFNISDLVPDITVIDFLSALQSRYNLGIYYNEATNKVRICFREPIAKSVVFDDITRYSSKIESIEDLRVTGFNLSVPKEDSDLFSVDESIDVESPEEPIVIKCGRLHQTASALISGEVVNGVRVSSKFGDKFGLRVFHYDGIVNNGTFTYQSCSISSPGFYEPLISSGPDEGIHDAFWKYWLVFQKNRRVVKIKASLPFRILKHIDWELKRRFDRNNYLIKSIRVRITNQKVSVSDVELYTMK